MLEQQDELCELWIEEPMEVRQHSRLYNLEPIGVGSPMVESLTSYATRLADAHSTSLNTLVSHEIAPQLKQSYLSRSLNQNGHATYQVLTMFWRESRIINGLASWAEDWVQALEQLTQRTDLRFLTMLSWKGVFTPFQLVRHIQSWCPACYEEWRMGGLVIYQPLLWALKAIHICPQHNFPLQQQCPFTDCKYKQSFLQSRSQVGYCNRCNRWLGHLLQNDHAKLTDLQIEERVYDQQLGRAIGEMLAYACSLQTLPNKEMIIAAITVCLNEVANGNVAKLARQLPISGATIGRWRQGEQLLQLEIFLRVCSHLESSPLNLLTGGSTDFAAFQKKIARETSNNVKPKRVKRKFDAELAQSTLEEILQSPEVPCPSMVQVAKRLGYPYARIFKKCPELCRAISSNYRDEKKKAWVERVQNPLEEILQSSEVPYPSMLQVAKRLGYPYPGIFRKYPELCRAISARYNDELKKSGTERIQKLCEEVRQATLSVHIQGAYPSNRKVRALLKSEISIQEPEAYATWKATLQELGWR